MVFSSRESKVLADLSENGGVIATSLTPARAVPWILPDGAAAFISSVTSSNADEWFTYSDDIKLAEG